MAIHVDLKKLEENEKTVTYLLSSITDETGIVEIDKKERRCKIISELPSDRNNFLAHRAMWALIKNWRENKLEDTIVWIS